jgi:hypothetical protein
MAKPNRLKEIIDCGMENTAEAYPARQNRTSQGPKSLAHQPAIGLLNEAAIWKTALQIETAEMCALVHSTQARR